MRVPFRRSLLAAAIGAALTFGAAQAQTEPQASSQARFDLARQPLDAAIREIARLTGINIVVDSRLVKGLETPGLKIRATPEDALKRVLEGTGLTPLYVDAHTVTILSEDEARAARAAAQKQEGTDRPFGRAQADATRSGPPPLNPPIRPGKFEIEEILVTGTHIRGATAAASPTLSIQREVFAEWGAANVQDVLRKLPQVFTGGASAHSSAVASAHNNETNSNFGSGVNLRGLGSGSTLVLLNGRRIAAGGLGAYVDVSAIALSALERIDVIPDGASAIYGSDAVGGVVNFILRDDFDGAETNLRYGSVTEGGLQQFDANQLLGATWDSGAFFTTLDYQDRSNLAAADRGYANALSQAPSDLIPQQQVWSALFNAHQDLGAEVRLAATLYANKRDVEHMIFSPLTQTDTWSAVKTVQAGGTLALDWMFAPNWNVSVAHTYGRSDTDQLGVLTAASTGLVIQRGTSDYGLDTSVTELIADGPIFAAPGGAARLAIGGEHRAESLEAKRRGLSQAALARPLSLKRDVDALFAEVNLPLVGAQNARPGLRRLDLIAAARHEDYSDFGASTDPKFGVVYSPVAGLDLRGTYGTSFRAPYLNQFDDSFAVGVLYQAADTGQITGAVFQSPGPDLGPENATTWSAGLDVRPEALPGLELSATYFDVDYEDRIVQANFDFAPSSDPLLSPRVSTPPDPELAAMLAFLAARDPTTVIDFTGLPGVTLDDIEATYDARLRNTAVTSLSGIDFVVSQSFTAAGHRFGAGVNASYLLKLENKVTSTSQAVDVVDTIFNPADLRLRSFLTWSRGSWSAAAFVNYVDSYRDNQLPQEHRISSWTTCDLSAAYRSGKGGLTVRLNVTNAFDRAPPKIIDYAAAYANPGYDTQNADPLGRYASLQLSLGW